MISEQLIKQVKFEEGLRLNAYKCTAGKWSVGYGRNIEARPYFEGELIPDTITKEMAERMLAYDLYKTEEGLEAAWGGFHSLEGARRDACINMAFQLGINGFMKFIKMRYAITGKEWEKAYKQGLDSEWAKQTPARAKRVMSQLLTGKYYEV